MTPLPDIATFARPFPALTPAQRYHLEVNGYVIVPGVLSAEECETVLAALNKVKRDLQSNGSQSSEKKERAPHEPFAQINVPHHIYMGGILEADPALTAFITHPRLVGMAEELLGGEARVLEFDAHINSRVPGAKFDKAPTYGLHRGVDIPFGSHSKNGLYQCNFVKTLTLLTDVGPDDGGTVVIAGSHKLDLPEADLIACAYQDRSLIHHVVAPKGSTLLFAETLMHATGQIKSDNERAIIIVGYGASMYPWWDGGQMSEAFKAQVPERFQTLLLGKAHWTRGPRYRALSEPADEKKYTLADGWWRDANSRDVN